MENGLHDSYAQDSSDGMDSFNSPEPSLSTQSPEGVTPTGVPVNSETVNPSLTFMKHGVYMSQSTVSPFPIKSEPSVGMSSEEEALLVIGTTVMDSQVSDHESVHCRTL